MKSLTIELGVAVLLVIASPRSVPGEKVSKGMHLDMGTNVLSPDSLWKLTMRQENASALYVIELSFSDSRPQVLTDISKPSANIWWGENGACLIVMKDIGFCTAANVFILDRKTGKASLIFASEEYNKRPFADYRLAQVDRKRGMVAFDVYENAQGIESSRSKRLLAREYVYLDGQTKYYVPNAR